MVDFACLDSEVHVHDTLIYMYTGVIESNHQQNG